jgi:hypothetical protein
LKGQSKKEKMKTIKPTTFSTLGIATLALIFSACGGAGNTTTNTSTANTANMANTTATTIPVANSNQAVVSNTTAASNSAPNQADESEGFEFQGELQVGKTESVILYVGMESGDYAAYCFANDSEAGRAILAACKDEEQCAVTGTAGEGACKVPGLEADLSASGRITKVKTVKSLGRKK